jgi:N-acetylglucosaminyldiphosphoundecaprenol N-acetyl-beta-D-mannosaminyltransferase
MGENIAPICDDLSREVYCILGIPIDAIEMPGVLGTIDGAVAASAPFLISTPNLNYFVSSQADSDFRESLLLSDLCPPDGVPIVLIARLMGAPIKNRVAGSDILEALKLRSGPRSLLKIFIFGSTAAIAAEAAKRLNREGLGVKCVGWLCPGFGDVTEFSQDSFIDQINSSGADFLVAALSAKKGQTWLQRNHARLKVPVRAHLGATVNFQADAVKRAPLVMQNLGLEWLWRIKEEPHLFKRYAHDGGVLVFVFLSQVLPLVVSACWRRLRRGGSARHDFVIVADQEGSVATVYLRGEATVAQVAKATACFRVALATGKPVTVDLSHTQAVDARFLGLFLMLRKQLKSRQLSLKFVGLSRQLERQFRLNGLGYLLSTGEQNDVHALH